MAKLAFSNIQTRVKTLIEAQAATMGSVLENIGITYQGELDDNLEMVDLVNETNKGLRARGVHIVIPFPLSSLDHSTGKSGSGSSSFTATVPVVLTENPKKNRDSGDGGLNVNPMDAVEELFSAIAHKESVDGSNFKNPFTLDQEPVELAHDGSTMLYITKFNVNIFI